MTDTDPLAHICSGWCNHPDVPTVIVTLAYLDKLRAAGVTLAPTPTDALRAAAQAVVDAWTDDESGMGPIDPELFDRLGDALNVAPTPPDALRDCEHDIRAIRNQAWQDGVNAANVDPDLARLRRIAAAARAVSDADAAIVKAAEEGDADDDAEAEADYVEAMDALRAALEETP